jgi:hypothetical protein
MASFASSCTSMWPLIRRLAAVLTLGTALVTSSTPAAARGGRGAAAGRSSGRAVSTPHGGAATVNRGAAASTPNGRTAVVHQGRAVSTPRGSAYVGRTAVVRTGPRPYGRAPYAHGGRHYYAYRPYAYHRYAPYHWGPAFHPWGAVVATVAATAIIISVADHQYRYDQGVWYQPSGDKYKVVPAPVGAAVSALPSDAVLLADGEYYYAGSYYKKTSNGYEVVAPRAGTVVDKLPPGGEEVTVGDRKYVRFGDTYYQPVDEGGHPKYEVVEVK